MPRWMMMVWAALLLAGCGHLEVGLPGKLGTPALVRETPDGPLVWACDRLGNLTLNGEVLHLPMAREDARFGITVVDARALPVAWRPEHVKDLEYALLVTSLDKASPLAIAGLRPLDAIVSVGLKPVTTPDELVAALHVEPGTEVALAGWRPDGRPVVGTPAGGIISITLADPPTLVAAASEGPRDAAVVRVPFLFERRSSGPGGAFGFGPLDSLFYWRAGPIHAYDPDPETGQSRYMDRFEWGALLNLVLWERATLPSGEERSRFRLFWFLSFGDDVP